MTYRWSTEEELKSSFTALKMDVTKRATAWVGRKWEGISLKLVGQSLAK